MTDRVQNWEAILQAEVKEAIERPFDAKTWNCAIFVHTTVQKILGQKIPFRKKRGKFEKSVDAVLMRTPVLKAKRGDVVIADVPNPTLGICLGTEAAFVGIEGLRTEPMSKVYIAWTV